MCGQVDAMKCEMQTMRTDLQSHIHDTRTQHQFFQQQLESIKASSSSISPAIPSPVIPDEAIERITQAIGDELHAKLKKISSQIQAVYKQVDDNNLLTAKLQKKFQARALSLENALEKINTFMDEERHLHISGIAKENATLKGQIASAVEDFEQLLNSFATNQTTHFQHILDAITNLLNLMRRNFP